MGLMRLNDLNSRLDRFGTKFPHNTGMGMEKVGKVMHEFKKGKLHIGKSKKLVKSKRQAIAVALSEAGISKKS